MEAKDCYIRMAAILYHTPLSARELSRRADVKLQEIFDFMFALDVGNFLGDNNRKTLQANHANTGVFRKLMNKFSLGRS